MKLFTPHVVFAGGGTGGHLFPGIAVAKQLVRDAPKTRITFAATQRTFEQERIRSAGFEYLSLPSAPLPRGPREAVRFVTDHLLGGYLARSFVREQRVSAVVGLGSYASVPMIRAARKQRVPYVLLEQNAMPGRATRWFARGATLVCSAFDDTYAHLQHGCRVRITGNPTRRGFAELSELDPIERESRRMATGLRLLVLGGSGGARTLNEQTPLALYKAGAALHGWEILHQAGERDLEATRELYRKLGLTATVVPFIDHIARALLESQFVISRAGGTTLAELACAAMPTILSPFPRATDDHQRKNAEAFVVAGGALMVDERDVDGRFDDALAAAVVKLATDAPLRERMSQAMLRAARPDAARIVARIVGDILRAGQFTNAA
jgi:UDP-N-acetylglucosamine--N-acetylmuramyl-(pentapeptide) pyrophosphoryl-undecaprenol N-acetylglucosamine transferase